MIAIKESNENIEVIEISKDEVGKIITSTGSRIAYCKFQKRDGSIRQMWYKNIAKKYIKGDKGKGAAYSAKEKQLSPIYDVKANGIRSIRWESVIEIGVDKKKYTFV